VSEPIKRTIEFEVAEYGDDSMFLRIAVASGEIGDGTFEVSTLISRAGLHLKIGDRQFVLGIEPFVRAIHEFTKENQ